MPVLIPDQMLQSSSSTSESESDDSEDEKPAAKVEAKVNGKTKKVRSMPICASQGTEYGQ